MSKDKLTELVDDLNTVDNKIADLQSEMDMWQRIRRNLISLDEDWTEEELMRPVL